MKFREIRNTLGDPNRDIGVLELENEEYHVKFMQNVYDKTLSMYCSPKHGNLDLRLYELDDRIGVNIHHARSIYYTDDQVRLLKTRLDLAMDAKKELEAIYKKLKNKADT